jgi:hypothetical protein
MRAGRLVSGGAGWVGIFGSTFPSIIEEIGEPKLEKMLRIADERWDVCLTPFEAIKAPEITQTSLPCQSGNHEKYSASFSAAIRTS